MQLMKCTWSREHFFWYFFSIFGCFFVKIIWKIRFFLSLEKTIIGRSFLVEEIISLKYAPVTDGVEKFSLGYENVSLTCLLLINIQLRCRYTRTTYIQLTADDNKCSSVFTCKAYEHFRHDAIFLIANISI